MQKVLHHLRTRTSSKATRSYSLVNRFTKVRKETELLTNDLEPEDRVIQTMADVSPTNWHLMHVTWFWETFVLGPNSASYQPFHPKYNFMYNSYYEAIGERYARPQRGFLSRPTANDVNKYRQYVTAEMTKYLQTSITKDLESTIELGINHEQQHQELILMDIKHVFSMNPLNPVFKHVDKKSSFKRRSSCEMISFPGGIVETGHDSSGFCFDNELPKHKVYLEPFKLATRLVTCEEYLKFINDGGYTKPEYWLSDGWATIQKEKWEAPLYWRKNGNCWKIFTLHGEKELDLSEPVVHVSFFEADAFAKWSEKRLPTEAEWECASRSVSQDLPRTKGLLHPESDTSESDGLSQMLGIVWQWTASPYTPYPGFKPAPGVIAEYNGKFMCSQMVLRGGCVASPDDDHIRITYRNFFSPSSRWCFSGIRLAE